MARSPLKPLPPLHREPRSPATLEQLALAAVPNPGETARQFLLSWQCETRAGKTIILCHERRVPKGAHQKIEVSHARIKVGH